MPGHEFFERLIARFALQAGAAKRNADRQADGVDPGAGLSLY